MFGHDIPLYQSTSHKAGVAAKAGGAEKAQAAGNSQDSSEVSMVLP